MGSIILDGAEIGEGALVPPGMKVPPNMLALGSLAKVVREVTEARPTRYGKNRSRIRGKRAVL